MRGILTNFAQQLVSSPTFQPILVILNLLAFGQGNEEGLLSLRDTKMMNQNFLEALPHLESGFGLFPQFLSWRGRSHARMLRSDTPAPPHRFLSKTPWKIKRLASLGTWAAARRHTQGGSGLQPPNFFRGQARELNTPILVGRFRFCTKTVLTETRKQFSIQRRMDMILPCLRMPSRGTQNWLAGRRGLRL